MAADDQTLRERASEFLIRRVVNTKERMSRFLKPGSIVVLVIVTVTGVGVVLREVDVPRPCWGDRSSSTVSLAVLGALTYFGYCLVVIGYRRMLTRSGQDAALYTACRDIAAFVETYTELPRGAIGVHVWTVAGLPGIRRLERRATFLSRDRPPSPITWRKGKGVLGTVWERDEYIVANLEVLADAASEEEFYAIPAEDRFSFTWHDARATEH